MAFSYEVMDGYGRFLCFLDRDNSPEERVGRITYNEKMLELGLAEPYFIWPNINPFRHKISLVDAVPSPDQLKNWVDNDTRFSQARKFVKDARSNHMGIFDTNDPLLLSPFELRFLARRNPPSRYVLDMSSNNPALLKPTDYYQISNPEDRLFVNDYFVPLFNEKGYQVQ